MNTKNTIFQKYRIFTARFSNGNVKKFAVTTVGYIQPDVYVYSVGKSGKFSKHTLVNCLYAVDCRVEAKLKKTLMCGKAKCVSVSDITCQHRRGMK